MSRIGKKPIDVPSGVEVKIASNNIVSVKGPKGSLEQKVDPEMIVKLDGSTLIVDRPTEQKRHKAMHGLYRSLIANMIKGVAEGYTTSQELVGVGYKAANDGQILDLTIGFSHHVYMQIPVEVKLETKTEKGQNPMILLSSPDKQLLGQVAAKIRSLRKPEPYKGKGIKFTGEILRRKAGKSAGKK
ncbi:MAG: 50S ribosomal protein L6 [Bacteroidetes bacterium]|nr:50S ribosomal protein L6 [Bacteroidota bacterium]